MKELTKEETEAIAAAVTAHLELQRTVDVETHRKHHEYIDTLIIAEETKAARKEQWIRVVGGWGLILTITAAAAAAWDYFKDSLK